MMKKIVIYVLVVSLLIGSMPKMTIQALAATDDRERDSVVNAVEGAVDDRTAMPLRYDDRYDISGKTVEILDAGKPTSYQVGYGTEENTVPDTAVVTLKDNTLIATGIGTAIVKIDGVTYEIAVKAAPISLLLLIGQSNMQGIDGDPEESIVCPDGMVYATYADRYQKTVEDVTQFAPSALTGQYCTINATGDTACLANYPVNMLTEVGDGREGMDSGIAYEWVRQTGEKVWVVNVGYGGSSITQWQQGGEHFNACLDIFSACQETLRREIAAGHFTLSHTGYFWCQGCADETQTAEWYVDQFLSMHESLKRDMAFSEERTFEFAGIIPIRAGHSWMGSYRAGVYKDSTNVPYYQSFKDLRFNGPRVAQYWMGNNPELTDIWNVCTIQEGWATLPDGTDGVAEYFCSAYRDGIVDYSTQVTQATSWYKPTTPAEVHDNIHYNQIGYNEIGREATRNALILMGEIEAPNIEATVEFMTWDGFTPATNIPASTIGASDTLVVPMVSPVWKSKDVTYAVSEGLTYTHYDLLAQSLRTEGSLTAVGAQGSVSLSPRTLSSWNWGFDGSGLVSDTSDGIKDNPLVKLAGNVTDGRFSNISYQTAKSIQLLHNEAWCVEVQISDWTNTSGSMILSSAQNATEGMPYFYFRPVDFFVGIGCYNGATYENLGIALKSYGIACNQGTHTYRFENRIAEDGSNMVWLTVDDTEIGPLTDHYVNSTLEDRNNHWLSGQDFAMSFLGTSNAPISGCVIRYLTVVESGYGPESHIHTWSGWETLSEPGPAGPGEEHRFCYGCGESWSRELSGVWQTHDLGKYLLSLPESVCSGLNLWTELPHSDIYYHSGTHWAKHESGAVCSVTIPVKAGDMLYATAWGKAGTNGHATSNGIRVTFFDTYGVCKTLAPAETYAEFTANGGYLVVPEGAVAVDIPMWNNSESNELYILNADHDYESVVTLPTCTEQGYTTYTCDCGDSYVDDYTEPRDYDWMLEDGEFKILLIGNSFSEDASNAGMPNSQMLDILQAMLGADVPVTVGLCYSGGKGLNWHATQSEQGNKSYSLRVIGTESGKWKSYGSYTSADALAWTDWDVVSLQHYEINTTTGKESNAYPTQVDPKFDQLQPATEFMLDYVDQYAPDAAVYFYMHWARAYKPNINESLATYNKMADFFPEVLDYIGPESGNRFETIIPVGLSVQNARTTYLAKLAYNTTAYADKNLNLNTDAQIGLQRDTGHLSYNIGRYLAALTFAETIIPDQLRADSYVLPDIRITESVGKLPKEYTEIAQKSAFAAVNSWKNGKLNEVTTIEGYAEDPTVAAAKTLTATTLTVMCGAGSEEIAAAALAILPEDFAVDSVTLSEEHDPKQGDTFTCVVTVRFGYTSIAVTVTCKVNGHTYENGTCTGCGAEDPNPYAGKTIACIGDSITYGVGVTRDETDYVTLLAQSLEMDYIRLGASGTTLCADGHATCNIAKLTENNLAGADVVTILMGINDFVQARQNYYALGTIDSTDTSTIYGAAHMWCKQIVALRKTDSLKDTEFYFMTPLITSWNNSVSSARAWDQSKTNLHGYTLRDLCNAIIEVCALYDIPVIDLNLVSGLYYNSAEDNTIAEFGGDGAHPGTVGHQMMAAAIENRLLQNHLRNDHDHSYGSWITTTYPNCDDGEQQRVCAVCTATERKKLDGKGHTYQPSITAPTCTEQGYTTYTCDCGDSYVDDYTDAVGHADKDNNGQCDGCEFAFRMGDVNGDGRVTVSDVARTNAYVKGVMTLTAEELLVADVNADGQVDDDDILHLSNEILGKGHVYEQGACTICGSVSGDMDLDGEATADDLTVLD